MTEAQRIAAGKRWIGEAFERICSATLGTGALASWEWQDEDLEYRIRCQLAGHEGPIYIPSQVLGCGRGQLVACGQPDAEHDPTRHDVEATLRGRVAALAGAPRSPSPPQPRGTRPTKQASVYP
jgi:hypothetical protein